MLIAIVFYLHLFPNVKILCFMKAERVEMDSEQLRLSRAKREIYAKIAAEMRLGRQEKVPGCAKEVRGATECLSFLPVVRTGE
jgi:hypothetical protein